MTANFPPTKARRWQKIAGVAAAGCVSFAVAASLRVWTSANDSEVVMPVERIRNQPVVVAAMQPDQGAVALVQTNAESPYQMTANPTRLDGHVTKNPFGNLNLLASVELASQASANAPARSIKKPKPKVEPPPPPPPVVEVPPPPPPMAPALPFTVVGGISGRQIAEGRPVAFLRQNDEVMAVRPGDEINNTYRVESITTEKIELTYLPLKQRQMLVMRP
jgi:hypothetical protein